MTNCRTKRKKVLLQYHVYEREYILLDILKKELEKRNFVVKILPMYDLKNCLVYNPDIIITHTIRDNESTAMFSIVKMMTGSIIIPMTVEGYYDLQNAEIVKTVVGINKMPLNLINYYIMWGPRNKRIEGAELLKQNKIQKLSNIFVGGYILYEKEKVLNYVKDDYNYKRFISWKRKYNSIITILTGFINAETSVEEAVKMSSFNSKADTKEYENEIQKFKNSIVEQTIYRKEYVKTIIKLAKELPNIGFVVKLHPVEMEYYKKGKCKIYNTLDGIKNILLIVDPIPVGAYLADSDLLIHYGSTTSLEAYIYHLPSILLYHNSYNSQFSHFSKAINIEDYALLKNNIEQSISFVEDTNIKKVLFDSFNWIDGKGYNPSENIADYIDKKVFENYNLDYYDVIKTLDAYDFRRYRAKAYIVYINLLVKFKIHEALAIKKIIRIKLHGGLLMFIYDLCFVLSCKVFRCIKNR